MKPALFLHIQKTAGTSVQEMARQCYGNNQVASHADYFKLGREGCERLNFISGHFGYGFAEPLMKDRFCFTFLRNPMQRLASLYSFCGTHNTDANPFYNLARESSLEGFLAHGLQKETLARGLLWNNQVWQLAAGYHARDANGSLLTVDKFDPEVLLAMAKEHLSNFHYIGFVETFDRDITRIFEHLGRPDMVVRRSNVSKRRAAFDALPAVSREIIHELTYLDNQLYAYALHKTKKAELGRLRWFWERATTFGRLSRSEQRGSREMAARSGSL